jgi:hypothetical protein
LETRSGNLYHQHTEAVQRFQHPHSGHLLRAPKEMIVVTHKKL